ncbi:MAG: acetoin utilization protein AcuC [Actinobacteria bacterium]|nr:acetoin utilization protein AcuC [Actinomycetota bacterium]MCB9411328.1 acetoin utilization protein AcuC [Actinomycetota bacterium]
MTGRAAFVWDDRLRAYDFGPGHPLAPVRQQLTYRLVRDFHLLDSPNVDVLDPVEAADVADILRVHSPDFVDAVKLASHDLWSADPSRGLGTEDVPAFPGMHDASLHVAGATMAAAAAVASGSYVHGINISGGLHHSHRGAASGFCVYNDIAVAIAWLLDQGFSRIAYVDVDVHHGDGVQNIFWSDPRVLTVSLHESGRTLFPGTGFPDEVGGRGAEGSAVNVALPAGTADDKWLRAFEAVVPDVLEAFEPQIIFSQHGCDSHADDPLAHLALSIDGQRRSYERVHELAHELTDGRWIAVGGGGYEWVDVVPRAWTHLTAIATGSPIAPESAIPEAFAGFVSQTMGRPAPGRMTDGRVPSLDPWDGRINPSDVYDRAIKATRRAVYPHLGIADDLHGM